MGDSKGWDSKGNAPRGPPGSYVDRKNNGVIEGKGVFQSTVGGGKGDIEKKVSKSQ